MEEKWRKELKYTVTEGESIVTARRLSSFMQRDKNLKGGREYLIRSLYFDNLYEKVLKEKLSGTAVRDKFRIRYYDFDTAFIRLEKKSKRYAVGHKYQCRLTAEEVQKIIIFHFHDAPAVRKNRNRRGILAEKRLHILAGADIPVEGNAHIAGRVGKRLSAIIHNHRRAE